MEQHNALPPVELKPILFTRKPTPEITKISENLDLNEVIRESYIEEKGYENFKASKYLKYWKEIFSMFSGSLSMINKVTYGKEAVDLEALREQVLEKPYYLFDILTRNFYVNPKMAFPSERFLDNRIAHMMFNSLRYNNEVSGIYLGNGVIDDSAFYDISKYLRVHNNLQFIEIENNKVMRFGCELLIDSLSSCFNIHTIIFKNQKMTPLTIKLLSKFLIKTETLERLDIISSTDSKHGYSDETLLAVNRVLKALSKNNVNGDSVDFLHNNIMSLVDYISSLNKLFDSLSANRSVKYFDFGKNKICCYAKSSIGKMIACNNTLEKIYLSDTKIDDLTARNILINLENNDTIEEIDLSNNRIGKDFMDRAKHTYINHKSLKFFDCRNIDNINGLSNFHFVGNKFFNSGYNNILKNVKEETIERTNLILN